MSGTHHYWNWRVSALDDELAHWQAQHPDEITTAVEGDFGEYMERTAELRDMLAVEPDPQAAIVLDKPKPRTVRTTARQSPVGVYRHLHTQRETKVLK
jgi:hypothetical protein